jgi:hypothetical protein
MPKHVSTAPLTEQIGRILDQRAVREFDGHLVVDFVTEDKIGGRVLHAHDASDLLTFGITVTVS